MSAAAEPRAVCWTCRRPAVVCYCRFVRQVKTRTRVVILQHPRERDVPINTARIAPLCLPEAELHVGLDWERLPCADDPSRPAVLLYPDKDAIDVEERPPPGPVTLVVVDGTWSQARTLVRRSPALAALPRYAFRPRAPSDYRIRKEPHESYVSTIEALVAVLGVLEGDPARMEALLEPFRAMVEAQLAYARGSAGTRHQAARRERLARPPRVPAPIRFLRERAADLVCVHGEANSWPYDAPERATCPDELVMWVARRPATGEELRAFVAPRNPLCPTTPHHLGVPAEHLLGGEALDAFRERWAAFLRPRDVMCSWGPYAPDLLRAAGGAFPSKRVDLRPAARSLPGGAASVVTHLPAGAERAPRRLDDLVALARRLSRKD